jgi:hypothetical protein
MDLKWFIKELLAVVGAIFLVFIGLVVAAVVIGFILIPGSITISLIILLLWKKFKFTKKES